MTSSARSPKHLPFGNNSADSPADLRSVRRASQESQDDNSSGSNRPNSAGTRRRRGSSHSSQQQQQQHRVGTLIPNRIFVGGIPSGATVLELKEFFAAFGEVRDVKIITDKSGVSKGYGFVTFESAGVAEEIIRRDGHEDLVFKERKLNLGPAIKKQPLFPRPELTNNAVFFTSGSVPYTYQNGMAVFHLPAAAAGVYSPQLPGAELSYSPYIAAQPQAPLMYFPTAAANHSCSPAACQQQQQQQQQQIGQSHTPSNGGSDTGGIGTFGIHQTQLLSPMTHAAMPCYGTPARTPVGGTLTPMGPYEGYHSCTSDYGTDASYTDQSLNSEQQSMEMDTSMFHFAMSPHYYQTSPVLCNPHMQAVRACAHHPMMMNSVGQQQQQQQQQQAAVTPPPIARIVSHSTGRAGSTETGSKAADRLIN